MGHNLFIYLSIDEHLGHLQFKAITNKDALTNCVQDFILTYAFISRVHSLFVSFHLEMEWLGYIGDLCLKF